MRDAPGIFKESMGGFNVAQSRSTAYNQDVAWSPLDEPKSKLELGLEHLTMPVEPDSPPPTPSSTTTIVDDESDDDLTPWNAYPAVATQLRFYPINRRKNPHPMRSPDRGRKDNSAVFGRCVVYEMYAIDPAGLLSHCEKDELERTRREEHERDMERRRERLANKPVPRVTRSAKRKV